MKPSGNLCLVCLFILASMIYIFAAIAFAMASLIYIDVGHLVDQAGFAIVAESDQMVVNYFEWKSVKYRNRQMPKVLSKSVQASFFTPIDQIPAEPELIKSFTDTILEYMNEMSKTRSKKSRIPIVFAATNGMRHLELSDSALSKQIMRLWYEAFAASKYKVNKNDFRIVSTQEEGLYQWYTTNSLYIYMKAPNGRIIHTGVMDFRNESLIIGFLPVEYRPGRMEIIEGSLNITFFGQKRTAYGNSIECFGSETIYRYFLQYLISKSDLSGQTKIENPCALKGDEYVVNSSSFDSSCKEGILTPILNVPEDKTYTIVGTANPQLCLNLLRLVLPYPNCNPQGCKFGQILLPLFTDHDEFALYGHFYSVDNDLSFPVGTDEYLANFNTRCSRPFEKHNTSTTRIGDIGVAQEQERRICLFGAFTLILLENLGLNPQFYGTTVLKATQLLNQSFSPSIAFGYLLDRLHQTPTNYQLLDTDRTRNFKIYIAVFLAFLTIFTVLFIVLTVWTTASLKRREKMLNVVEL